MPRGLDAAASGEIIGSFFLFFFLLEKTDIDRVYKQ